MGSFHRIPRCASEMNGALAAVPLVILWIQDPNGPYEPWTVLCGLVGAACELLRRSTEHPAQGEPGAPRPHDPRLSYVIAFMVAGFGVGTFSWGYGPLPW